MKHAMTHRLGIALVGLACVLTLATAGGICQPASKTAKERVVTIGGGESYTIPETGSIVVVEDNELKIVFSPAADGRLPSYKDVDLQSGDHILLANGKRIRTTKELADAHDATPVAGPIKLGIQRGKEMLMVSFSKADPKDLPKRTMRVETVGGEGTAMLPAVGVMLRQKGRSVTIDALISGGSSAVDSLDVKGGDVIHAINGKPVSTVQQFVAAYDALAIGAPVTLKTSRKGTAHQVNFPKPKPVRGPVTIRRTIP